MTRENFPSKGGGYLQEAMGDDTDLSDAGQAVLKIIWGGNK